MHADLKLWELGEELESLNSEIIEADGEITPDMEARLDAVRGAFDEKAERLVLAIKANEAREKMVGDEIERLKAIAKPYQNAAKGLRAYLYRIMVQVDVRRVDRPRGKAWIQKNGKPSVLFGGDPRKLPPEFQKVTVDLNRDAVYAAHKDGVTVEGCEVVIGSHLRIK
jgi:hypothetical protein